MKTFKLIVVGIFLLVSNLMQSQVSINVNIGVPPPWGPAGYSNIEFYYLPDIQVYYDIRNSQFIYFHNGRWNRSSYLPSQYRNYDLYNGYKVVLRDYHGSHPYYYFNSHKAKYYKGYKGNPQKTIGRNPNYHENSSNFPNKKVQGEGNRRNENRGYKEGNGNKGKGNNKH
jgi:hypothetical protein